MNRFSITVLNSKPDKRACDECRRRKIKCLKLNGTLICNSCTKLNKACSYNDPILRRGPKPHSHKHSENDPAGLRAPEYIGDLSSKEPERLKCAPVPAEVHFNLSQPQYVDQNTSEEQVNNGYDTNLVTQCSNNELSYNTLDALEFLLHHKKIEWLIGDDIINILLSFFRQYGDENFIVSSNFFIRILQEPLIPCSFHMFINTLSHMYLTYLKQVDTALAIYYVIQGNLSQITVGLSLEEELYERTILLLKFLS